jgi:uncharacterized protein with PQ loop repeat
LLDRVIPPAGCESLAHAIHKGYISLGMFAVMATGTVLWIAYAVIRLDPPLIAANAVTFCLVGTILVLKLRHG